MLTVSSKGGNNHGKQKNIFPIYCDETQGEKHHAGGACAEALSFAYGDIQMGARDFLSGYYAYFRYLPGTRYHRT